MNLEEALSIINEMRYNTLNRYDKETDTYEREKLQKEIMAFGVAAKSIIKERDFKKFMEGYKFS